MREFLARGPGDLDGVVFPDVAIGALLDFEHLLPSHLGVIVNGDDALAHVKAHVVAVERRAQHTGDDVLAGVLLHVVEAARPVEFARDLLTDGERAVTGVDNLTGALLHVEHLRPAERAAVGGLAAALRVEGGLVERHEPRLFLLYAAGHARGERAAVYVVIIELFRFHSVSSQVQQFFRRLAENAADGLGREREGGDGLGVSAHVDAGPVRAE